jgi:hypothetical protein
MQVRQVGQVIDTFQHGRVLEGRQISKLGGNQFRHWRLEDNILHNFIGFSLHNLKK